MELTSMSIAIKMGRQKTYRPIWKIYILSNHNRVKILLLVKAKETKKRMPIPNRLQAQIWDKHTWTMAKILETPPTCIKIKKKKTIKNLKIGLWRITHRQAGSILAQDSQFNSNTKFLRN
jgi:hypothetical protein